MNLEHLFEDNSSLHTSISIMWEPTQSSSASCAMLMYMLSKTETAVHGCWHLGSILIFYSVATGSYPFHHSHLSTHACGFDNLDTLERDLREKNK